MKLKMNIKDYFDTLADIWDDRFSTPPLFSFLDKLVPQFDLKSGQKVLDVGTGTGVLIPYLIKAVGPSGSVTAIDYSEKMIRKCKTKHSQIRNINIKVGNIEEEAFPPEFFDAAICFGVFPHIKRKEKALRNITHMLKSGGKLVIAHALSSEELKTHHSNISKHVAHSAMPKKSKMIQLLKQKGFVGIRIRDEPGCYLCIAQKPNKA